MKDTNLAINVALRNWCESSLLNFARYMFKEVHNRHFNVQPFHVEICEALEKAHRGDIRNLIINIPPRTGKTELGVLFMAWELAKNPNVFHLHFSYSDALATRNSAKVKEYVSSPAFTALWPISLRPDTKGKSYWLTTNGSGVYSAAMGGQITGWGAGIKGMGAGTGCIIIDDPLKPGDSSSDVVRNKTNDFYTDTIQNRVNNPNVPQIVIMQRLHEEDLSGFLIDGGTGQEWKLVKIPVLDDKGASIWEEELPSEDLLAMRRTNPYFFAGQYMQEPAPLEGGTWKRNWFELVEKTQLPQDIIWEMIIDGAYTKNTANDPTGIIIAGKSLSKDILYVYHAEDSWLEMPELIERVKGLMVAFPVKPEIVLAEPKASGKSLIQMLRTAPNTLNAAELHGNFVKVSKEERAASSSPYIEGGRVKLVKADWNDRVLHQVSVFPNGKHDEYVDCISYAIERTLMNGTDWVLI